MRNPIRLKNLKPRFLPVAVLAMAGLYFATPTATSLAGGSSLVAVGLALRAWGAGHLVKTDSFTVTGPYGHVRHPLYLGTLGVAGGLCVALGGISAAVSMAALATWFFGLYFPRKERREGDRLRARYGAQYEAYRENVAALWPRLSAWRPAARDEPLGVAPSTRWSARRYDENNELGTLLAAAIALVGVFGRAAVGV